MKKYKFEIKNSIEVIVEDKNRKSARDNIKRNLDLYEDEMLGPDCYISEGEEVK